MFVKRLMIIFISTASIMALVILFLKDSGNNFCANSITCISNLDLQIDNNEPGVFAGMNVIPPVIDLTQDNLRPKVLGESEPVGEKHIYVDLSKQKLSAYEGEKLVLETFISSGKWAPTPPGEYTIWIKVRAQKMSGGQGADYYYLPNVPFVMFFYNDKVSKARGFSLHGAYWHSNFGNPMSHGCVNMRIVDAEAIYNWADPKTKGTTTQATADNPGTKITIFGEIPKN